MIFTALNMRKAIIGIAAATMLGCSGGSDSGPRFLSAKWSGISAQCTPNRRQIAGVKKSAISYCGAVLRPL